MSDTISVKKLKMIMYRGLRWRLQLPEYYEHNPIPEDDKLSEFSQGVKCAYRDLLQEIDKLEEQENQRRFWNRRRISETLYKEEYIDEIRRY